MNILITGITGFAGSHLADYLLAHHPGVQIHGTKRWRSDDRNIRHLAGRISLHDCDIKDAHNVYEVVSRVRPDQIFHLAAQSFVPTSWESPAETLSINIIGQANLLEAVRKLKTATYNPVIQIACSSEEYGLVTAEEAPIRETNPLRPLSPYAVSKVGQDYLGYQYFKSYGLLIVRTRAFNHSGPRRGDVFVDSNFAHQVAAIERGLQPPQIKVGNLTAVRDFTDVRDVVAAYWLAAQRGEPGEVYNIASGTGVSIQQVLDRLLELSTVGSISIVHDPARQRPSDVPLLVGDATKFRQRTGWIPTHGYLTTTLPDTLAYWREQLR